MSDQVKTLLVNLYYPRVDLDKRKSNQPQAVEVQLEDVRAANSISIDYDFERDGYRIRMPSKFSWNVGEELDPELKEVAFIPSWATGEPD
jgi:hypothetical protein